MSLKASDIFGIIVRTIGLLLALWGIWYLVAAGIYLPSTIVSLFSHEEAETSSIHYFLYAIPAILFGLGLMLFANKIVEVSYRAERRNPPVPPDK